MFSLISHFRKTSRFLLKIHLRTRHQKAVGRSCKDLGMRVQEHLTVKSTCKFKRNKIISQNSLPLQWRTNGGLSQLWARVTCTAILCYSQRLAHPLSRWPTDHYNFRQLPGSNHFVVCFNQRCTLSVCVCVVKTWEK